MIRCFGSELLAVQSHEHNGPRRLKQVRRLPQAGAHALPYNREAVQHEHCLPEPEAYREEREEYRRLANQGLKCSGNDVQEAVRAVWSKPLLARLPLHTHALAAELPTIPA